MTTINSHTPGSFCWIELGTSDQPAAKNFYQQLFGWTSDDMPMGPSDFYTMFKLNGREVAAGYTLRPGQRSAGVPPHWMLYIAVANCDESAKRVSQLGGTVLMEPMDVFTAGRMAVLQDPTGTVFCIWQPKDNKGMQVHNEEGAFCWADLLTKDREKAVAFYTALFGWKIEKEGDGYWHIKNGEHHIGGVPPSQGLPPGTHNQWSVYFHTEDCNVKAEQAKKLGARLFIPPSRMEKVGTMSVVEDPQGATFCLFQKE
jgi:predicted enzyme related to lactoylglutathione lyase